MSTHNSAPSEVVSPLDLDPHYRHLYTTIFTNTIKTVIKWAWETGHEDFHYYVNEHCENREERFHAKWSLVNDSMDKSKKKDLESTLVQLDLKLKKLHFKVEGSIYKSAVPAAGRALREALEIIEASVWTPNESQPSGFIEFLRETLATALTEQPGSYSMIVVGRDHQLKAVKELQILGTTLSKVKRVLDRDSLRLLQRLQNLREQLSNTNQEVDKIGRIPPTSQPPTSRR